MESYFDQMMKAAIEAVARDRFKNAEYKKGTVKINTVLNVSSNHFEMVYGYLMTDAKSMAYLIEKPRVTKEYEIVVDGLEYQIRKVAKTDKDIVEMLARDVIPIKQKESPRFIEKKDPWAEEDEAWTKKEEKSRGFVGWHDPVAAGDEGFAFRYSDESKDAKRIDLR